MKRQDVHDLVCKGGLKSPSSKKFCGIFTNVQWNQQNLAMRSLEEKLHESGSRAPLCDVENRQPEDGQKSYPPSRPTLVPLVSTAEW